MSILTISGWSQAENIISNTLDLPSDYLTYHNKEFPDIITNIQNSHYDYIIGWSLGGQIAMKLLQYIKIKKLILISTPYQFVNDKTYHYGITEKEFSGFKYLLNKNKKKLLEHFNKLMGESPTSQEFSKSNTENLLYWLQFLKDFNGNKYSYNITSLLIYGKLDKIVNYHQGKIYTRQLKNSSLEIFPLASHIPFLHDPIKFNLLVNKFLNE